MFGGSGHSHKVWTLLHLATNRLISLEDAYDNMNQSMNYIKKLCRDAAALLVDSPNAKSNTLLNDTMRSTAIPILVRTQSRQANIFIIGSAWHVHSVGLDGNGQDSLFFDVVVRSGVGILDSGCVAKLPKPLLLWMCS